MDSGRNAGAEPQKIEPSPQSGMDQVTRAFYELKLVNYFLTKKGNEFQDFFSSIMEKRYPGDFIRVRPWGKIGDRKNDGYLASKRFLFQCYAPNEIEASKTVAKMGDDFSEALPHWQEFFSTWIFVHNSKDGLGPEVTKKLLELDKAHKSVRAISWGFEELRKAVFQLNFEDLVSVLGYAPSHEGIVNLGLNDLAPVLDHIELLLPLAEPDLRPVPADKLKLNLLSDHVATLLKAGMTRADLVGRYFRAQPTKEDKIAESFRVHYQNLRSKGLAPDEIFSGLQRFAGGSMLQSPSHQNSVLAVLAYFFEKCDIFERPEMEVSVK